MPLILEGVDLVALAGVFLLIGFLMATRYTFVQFAKAIDVDIAGVHPFGFLAGAIEGVIVPALDTGIKAAGHVAHDLLAGLVWSFDQLLKIGDDIVGGVENALGYLWTHVAKAGAIAGIGAVEKIARKALAAAEGAPGSVVAKVRAEAAKAEAGVQRLERDLANLHGLTLATVAAAIANPATALAQAVGRIAHDAEVRAEAYAAPAVSAVEGGVTQAVAEVASLGTIAERDTAAAFAAALAGAEGIALHPGADLTALERYVKGIGAAGLIAAVPGLAYLVSALVREAGLSRAECRQKVGDVCAVNPAAWTRLLGLAGFLAIGFDFKGFVEAATVVADGIGTGVADLERPFDLQLPPLKAGG